LEEATKKGRSFSLKNKISGKRRGEELNGGYGGWYTARPEGGGRKNLLKTPKSVKVGGTFVFERERQKQPGEWVDKKEIRSQTAKLKKKYPVKRGDRYKGG